jgi:hypothetical protein
LARRRRRVNFDAKWRGCGAGANIHGGGGQVCWQGVRAAVRSSRNRGFSVFAQEMGIFDNTLILKTFFVVKYESSVTLGGRTLFSAISAAVKRSCEQPVGRRGRAPPEGQNRSLSGA